MSISDAIYNNMLEEKRQAVLRIEWRINYERYTY